MVPSSAPPQVRVLAGSHSSQSCHPGCWWQRPGVSGPRRRTQGGLDAEVGRRGGRSALDWHQGAAGSWKPGAGGIRGPWVQAGSRGKHPRQGGGGLLTPCRVSCPARTGRSCDSHREILGWTLLSHTTRNHWITNGKSKCYHQHVEMCSVQEAIQGIDGPHS